MLAAHRKITISIILVVVLVLTIFFYEYAFQPRAADIEYSLGYSGDVLYPDRNNTVTIQCGNRGNRDATFYLVLNLTNVSFSALTEQPYVQLNSTLVKFPFSLQGSGGSTTSGSKSVFFTINENVTFFAFEVSLEKIDQNPRYSMGTFYYSSYRWNETSGNYQHWQMAVNVT
jgi:uncharacterized membrane protein